MSTLVKVLVPPTVLPPRGADWAPALLTGLARAARGLWRGLEAVGRSRANRELARLAVQYAHQPEVAQLFRDAIDRDFRQRTLATPGHGASPQTARAPTARRSLGSAS